MNRIFLIIEGSSNNIGDLIIAAREQGIEASKPVNNKNKGTLDAPISPDQIKVAIEFFTIIVHGAVAAIDFMKAVRRLAKEKREPIVVKDADGVKILTIEGDTTDQEIREKLPQ